MLQLSKLEGFYWVAKEGGFSKAARAFPYPITQPGVYQQVKRLEDDLGCTLFLRAGRHGPVELTAAGRTLYAFCAPFFEELPAVERALRGRAFGGPLHIDGSPMTIRHLLPAWLARLSNARPDIELALHEVDVADVERLRRGEADVIVDYLEEWPSWVRTQKVATLYTFLVWPASRGDAPASDTSLPSLDALPMIAYPQSWRPRELQQMGASRLGLSPSRVITARSAESILGFVAAGLGYALVPWIAREGPKVHGVASKRLDAPEAIFDIVAATHELAAENPLVEALMAARD